jgi:hypothetical protein
VKYILSGAKEKFYLPHKDEIEKMLKFQNDPYQECSINAFYLSRPPSMKFHMYFIKYANKPFDFSPKKFKHEFSICEYVYELSKLSTSIKFIISFGD